MSDPSDSTLLTDTGKARPPNAGKGRVKGVPNKLTADLKKMILGALEDAGGQAYLAKQANESPGAFLTLIGKILPMQMTGPDGKDLIPQTLDASKLNVAEREAMRALLLKMGGGE